MSKFFDKYNVVENVKSTLRNNVDLTPEEKNRQKLVLAIEHQLHLIDQLIDNNEIVSSSVDSKKKTRVFWQETLGGYLFTPRFGNDFLFGKNRGVHCTSYQELRALLTDFRVAVTNGEFDASISEISSSRKGRGIGVSRKKS